MPYVQADEEVHDKLAAAEVPPFFALGWFITWFAHSVDNLAHISRLFDLFMAAHPLMPLYVTAVVIKVPTEQDACCIRLLYDALGDLGVTSFDALFQVIH